ncbi:MAG: hypothetical protein AVDCRST_MAG87-3, partial [uncultured Thermomicrobiales bacterium]
GRRWNRDPLCASAGAVSRRIRDHRLRRGGCSPGPARPPRADRAGWADRARPGRPDPFTGGSV